MKKIYILLENILMHPTESRCRALHVTLESLLRVISISLASPHPAEGALVCRSRKKTLLPDGKIINSKSDLDQEERRDIIK